MRCFICVELICLARTCTKIRKEDKALSDLIIKEEEDFDVFE
jgi:hypothetical protein